MHNFSFHLLWQQRGTIAKFLGAFVLLSLLVSALTPIRYASTAELLVVQRGIFSRDPFVASRSTEYLSQVLAQVVTSRSFLDAVRQTNPNVLVDLPLEPNREKRAWNKRVKSHVVRDTGILKISTYDRSRDRVGLLADTVVQTLVAHSAEYHGEGDAVSIRVLEAPLTTRYPASPNILRNLLVALVAGLLAALGSLYLGIGSSRLGSNNNQYSSSEPSESRSTVKGHKHLFDWHVPGETSQAALERIHPEPATQTTHDDTSYPATAGPRPGGGKLPATSSDHAATPPNLPTVFEHMSGRMS